MADDDTLKALRDELERQRQEQEQRHQALVAELQRRDGEPAITAAGARQTMEAGYAQTAAERAAKKAGEDQ